MVRAIDSIHIEGYGMGASECHRAWMQEQLWRVVARVGGSRVENGSRVVCYGCTLVPFS